MFKTKYFSFALTLFSLLLFLSFSASAKDTWLRINSKNFHLIGNASEKDIRKVATRLEQFRETFRLLFTQANLNSSIPTNVIVFKSDSAYKPFKPKRADGKIDNFVAGYFQSGRDVNYITISTEGDDADTFGTIFHEYVHFMLDINFGKSDIPPWFNEGLAEYYQTFAIENDQKVKLGMFQQGHLQLLSQSQLMPLETLFNVSNYALHQQGNHSRSIFYAQSWALIHYLLQHNKGEKNDSLGKFLTALVNDIPPEKAFQDAFQMNYAQMEKELKKYVTQNTYFHQEFTFKNKLTFDTEMKVSPLSEADSNSYLGDLLLHTNRADDAETYLQTALKLEPNSSLANTALGMVKYRQRKFDEARKYLEAAISDDQKNYFALYNYAYLLSKERQDEFGYVSSYPTETINKMRDALKKSIVLNPAYTESYELLAFINMVNNSNLDEAVDWLKKSLAYQPTDQQTILRIAEIYARQEKFAEAKKIAEKISKTADEPNVKSRADNLLRQITNYETVAAENEAMRKKYEKLNEEERKRYEAQRNANRNQRISNQREMSPEEIAKINENAQILSINQALKKPASDEKQLIGKITKITCVQKMIVYTVKTETGNISLFSRDFQNLALVAFDSGAESAQIGCNSSLSVYNAVLTFKPSTTKSTYEGELIAIDFVPANFRFMKESDVPEITAINGNSNSSVQTEPENRQPPRIKENDETIVTNSPPPTQDFEAKRKEAMMQYLKNSLRQPLEGEIRLTGMLEKIECDNKFQYFVFKTETQSLKLKVQPNLQIKSFVPDLGGVAFQCGMKQFNANAVVTYKPNGDAKAKFNGDLIALEFVPNSFKLE